MGGYFKGSKPRGVDEIGEREKGRKGERENGRMGEN
jgi:hypothetical protein